jgi:hypothetical protein
LRRRNDRPSFLPVIAIVPKELQLKPESKPTTTEGDAILRFFSRRLRPSIPLAAMFRAAVFFAIASWLVAVRGAVAQNQEPDDPVATSGRGPWSGLSEELQAARLGQIRTDPASSAETFEAASATITESSEAEFEAAIGCDEQKMAALHKAMAGAYKPLFYDNNFDYLCDDCWCDWWLGDGLKRNCLGDWGRLDVGGQYRARLHNERNIRGLGLTGRDDDFLLHRTRLFGNLEVGRRLRFYAEYIDAESNYEDFPSRAIEVNRSDMLIAVLDPPPDRGACAPAARAGRVTQELQVPGLRGASAT